MGYKISEIVAMENTYKIVPQFIVQQIGADGTVLGQLGGVFASEADAQEHIEEVNAEPKTSTTGAGPGVGARTKAPVGASETEESEKDEAIDADDEQKDENGE